MRNRSTQGNHFKPGDTSAAAGGTPAAAGSATAAAGGTPAAAGDTPADAGSSLAQRLAPVLKALVIVGCCYGVGFLFGHPSFLTNDDAQLQSTLSGALTGSPFPIHPYLNVFMSYALSRLYALVPGIQWWFWYSHALLMLGMTITHVVICRRIARLRSHRIAAYLLLASFDCALVLHSIAAISFTVVPAILVTAVICVLTCIERPLRKREVVALVTLLLIAFCHRRATIYASAPFIVLALVRYAQNRHGLGTKTVIVVCKMLIPALALLVSVNLASDVIKNHINGEEFVRYDAARSTYIDYPHDKYWENPEAFERVGWDQNLAELVRRWCFLDPRVNADAFRYLSSHSKNAARTTDPGELLQRLKSSATDQESAYAIAFVACVAIVALASCLGRGRHAALYVQASVLGVALLLLLLLYAGRLIYRTMIIVLIPATVLNLSLLFDRQDDHEAPASERTAFATLGLGGALVLAAICMAFVFGADRLAKVDRTNWIGDSTVAYVCQHPNNIYVKSTDVPTSLNPFATYTNRQPTNLFSWSIPSTPSAVFVQQLARNNLSSLTGKDFARKNVYYVCATKPESMDGELREFGGLFYEWLKQDYGATGFELVDTVCEGVYVYRMLFA